jgi:DNA processing protein
VSGDFSLFDQTMTDVRLESSSNSSAHRKVQLLALGEIPGIGHAIAVRLYDGKNFASLFTANRDELLWIAGECGVPSPHSFADTFVAHREHALETAAFEYERYETNGIEFLLDTDEQYPERLKALADRPRWLFVKGNVELLSSERLITVVGTRQPSKSGLDLAKRIVTALVKRGFAPVSGLAEGIDAEVHRATVDLKGQTVAVLGTGIFNDFPANTSALRGPIVQNAGAIITEYFPKEHYSKQRFVQRNRIQAALSPVTIPVEAAVPSGTFHTIRFALQYSSTVLGVKWAGSEDQALQAFLREHNQPIVEVPIEDDPFLEALGKSYDYWHFLKDSQQARRKAQIDRAIRFARNVIRAERLSDFELEAMIKRIREPRSE